MQRACMQEELKSLRIILFGSRKRKEKKIIKAINLESRSYINKESIKIKTMCEFASVRLRKQSIFDCVLDLKLANVHRLDFIRLRLRRPRVD